MTITNPLFSIIEILRANSEVAAEVGSVTINGQTLVAVTGEIDDEWIKLMPRQVVLVREAPGLPKDDQGPLGYPRIDVRCYGKEPGGVYEASKLSLVVYSVLQGSRDMARGIAAITLNSGPTPGREPDTEWAYNLRTYDVLAEG